MGIATSRSAARYNSILVHAGGRPEDESLTRDAVYLANVFGARLLGVSTPCMQSAARSSAEEHASNILIDAAGDRFKTASSQVHAGAAWRKVSATPTRALLGLAWAADLLLVDLPASSAGQVKPAEISAILKKTHRAVLVRTDSGRPLVLKRALILWDQSAACCRSILAALPLLAKAEYIVILPAKQSYLSSTEQVLSDLERGLRIRNLPVQVVHKPGRRLKETPDDYVRNFDPDILVMSGRSRWGAEPVVDRLQRFQTHAMLSL